MGYDVHITRAQDWIDSERMPIAREEWRALVESDPEITPDPDNGPDDYLFVGHPKEPWPLWWHKGEVYTKNPDKHIMKKMIEIAAVLNANVQGDDGERYTD